MSRTVTAIQSVLGANQPIGPFDGRLAPYARLDVDGQNGLTTDLRTLNAMTPYVKQDVLCYVLEVPRGFTWLPGGEMMGKALKTLMETHTETIDGLDASIKAEYNQVIVGAAEQLDVFVRSTRERSEPSHKWTEKYGMAISRLMETWITMLLGDPITKTPGIVSLAGAQELFSVRGQGYNAYTLIPENTSMTCLYIEPDPTRSFPVKAFLCTNMMPDNGGDMTAGLDKQGSPSVQEVTIKFTCTQEVGIGVLNLAAEVLSHLNKVGLSSNNRRAYIGSTYAEAASNFIRTKARTLWTDKMGRQINAGDGKSSNIGLMAQSDAIATTESIISNIAGDAVANPEGRTIGQPWVRGSTDGKTKGTARTISQDAGPNDTRY